MEKLYNKAIEFKPNLIFFVEILILELGLWKV
jgi:hypothetical protein